MKVYAAVARMLAAHGVKTLFGVMGDANMQYIVEFMERCGGRFVGAAHESGAVSMADGFGRVSGHLGVATVTHGPGLTNAVTALVEATRNRSSLLLLTGETRAAWDASPQVMDVPGLIAPTGAGYERVYRADTLVADFERAIRRVAVEHRPIVLNLSVELLDVDTADSSADGRPPLALPVTSAVDTAAIDRALGLAAGANRPVVLAGRGAVVAKAHDALVRLADLLGAPLATTLLAKDYFRGHPRNLGICGTVASSIGSAAIADADCIVAFGAGLNKHTAGALLAGKRIVHCDVDPARIGASTPVDVPVVGDARLVAEAMFTSLSEAGFAADRNGSAELERRLAAAAPSDDFEDRSDGRTVDARAAMLRFDEVLPAERMVITDSGRFLLAPWRYLHVADPACFVHTTNFASIGLAVGTAIGAAAARPDQLAVAVVGDGGFMMHVGEFSTAVRNDLPLVVIVLNDGAYGAEYASLQHHGMDPMHSLIDWPDLAPIANALGGRGVIVRSLEDIDRLGEVLHGLRSPLLVDVKVDPAVQIWT